MGGQTLTASRSENVFTAEAKPGVLQKQFIISVGPELVGKCSLAIAENAISANFRLQLENGNFKPSEFGTGLSEDFIRIEIGLDSWTTEPGFLKNKVSFAFNRQEIDGIDSKPSYVFDLSLDEGLCAASLLSRLSLEETDERIKTVKDLLKELVTILDKRMGAKHNTTDVAEEEAACNNAIAEQILNSVEVVFGINKDAWEKVCRDG